MTADEHSHVRPDGVDDETVEAVGKVSEAYEYVVRARGALYEAHQLMGHADGLFGDAADLLRAAGHGEQADLLDDQLVGRNMLDGRWTFQMVEEYDRTYYDVATALERQVRDELMAGRRHVFEAELKDDRITPGRPGHERRPPQGWDPAVAEV